MNKHPIISVSDLDFTYENRPKAEVDPKTFQPYFMYDNIKYNIIGMSRDDMKIQQVD